MHNYNRQQFISAYIIAALWSSTDEEGEPLDSGEYELSAEASDKLADYAGLAFEAELELIEQFIEETETDYTQAGYSFWLSCNGHGAGLFDFTDSHAALALDKKCDQYGHYGAIYKGFDLYVGDDGVIYV
jgi:hypothetical protein